MKPNNTMNTKQDKASNQPKGDNMGKHTVKLYPLGRCNNCLFYRHNDEDLPEGNCPNCKTDEYLMDMPEIAASPELYEALKKLHEEYAHQGKGYWVGTGQMVERLLAKAEGR